MELLRRLGYGVAAVTLPDPDRRPFLRQVDGPKWSAVLGAVELAVGFWLLSTDARAYWTAQDEAVTAVFLKGDPAALNDPGVSMAFYLRGLLIWFLWALRPMTWLLASVVATGLARLAAVGIHGEVIGEPSIWVVLRVWQWASQRLRTLRGQARRGPKRPDRWIREAGGVTLLTVREQGAWNDLATIEVDGRFFRLSGVDERLDGRWRVLAYRLREEDPAGVIRSLVRYEGDARLPPAGSGS